MGGDQKFQLTKDYIQRVFSHLSETEDLSRRGEFFSHYIVPDATWTMKGSGYELAGVRHSVADHVNATFNRLGKKLTGPIKFTVERIILDADDNWACVEAIGEATRKSGKHYNNEYAWITRWNDEGKMVELSTYCDTALAQQALDDPEMP